MNWFDGGCNKKLLTCGCIIANDSFCFVCETFRPIIFDPKHYFLETFDFVGAKTLNLFECDLVETLDLIDWVAGFVAKKFDLFVYYLAEKLELNVVEKLNFAENYFAGSAERHYFDNH